MSRAVALALLATLSACSFKGSLDVTVQVYGGEVAPVEYAPDGASIVAGAQEVVESCAEAQRRVSDLSKALRSAGKTYATVASGFAEHLQSAWSGKIAPSAAKFAKAWAELATAAAGAADAAKLKELLAERKKSAFAAGAYAIDSVDLHDLLFTATKKKLGRTTPEARLFQDLGEALVSEKISDALSKASRSGGTELAKKLSDMKFADEDFEIKEDALLMTRAKARSDDAADRLASLAGALDPALTGVKAAGETTIAAARPFLALPAANADAPKDLATLLRSATDLRLEANKFASQIAEQPPEGQARGLLDAWNGMLKQLVEEGRFAPLRARLPEDLRQMLKTALEASGELRDLGEVQDALRRDLDRCEAALAAATAGPAQVRQLAGNLVALVRSRPFEAADPNIRTITKVENEKHWHLLPVDMLETSGDGLTQFVIVQDGPTAYRLKELHVDPAGVVDLRLSVGDVALDLLEAVAQAQLGVSLGGGGEEEAKDKPPGPPPRDVLRADRERLLRTQAESVVGDLRRALAAEAARSPGPDAARLRAILEGHLARIDAVVAEAKKLLEPAPAPPPPAPK